MSATEQMMRTHGVEACITSLACLRGESARLIAASSVASALISAQISWMFSTSPDTSAVSAFLRWLRNPAAELASSVDHVAKPFKCQV